MAWAKLEAEQVDASTYGSPSAHATQSVGRQVGDYIPELYPYIVQPLMEDGTVSCYKARLIPSTCLLIYQQSAVQDVIERMDEYYLSKEGWDTIVELGVGDRRDELVFKKIAPATKTAFTKK